MSTSPKLMSPIPRLLLSKDVPLNVFQCPIMCLSPATLEGKGVQIYINQPRWKTNILNHTLTFSSLPAFKISGRLCFCHIGYSTDGCLILPNNSNFDFLFFPEFYLFTPTYPIVAYCYWLKCFFLYRIRQNTIADSSILTVGCAL